MIKVNIALAQRKGARNVEAPRGPHSVIGKASRRVIVLGR